MVELTWLGQAGFRLDWSGVSVLIDPFLSPHEGRAYPPPPAAPYLEGVTWLFATHEHLDHLDTGLFPELLERAPNVQIVVPAPLVDAVLEGGFARQNVHGVGLSSTLTLTETANVRVVPAFHAISASEPYGDGNTGDGPRFVGYIFRLGQTVIYHSGDTVITPALHAATEGLAPHIALLPINGRDYYREQMDLVGNMDAREAVQFASKIGARTLVPMHWDMFDANAVRVSGVLDEVVRPGSGVHILVPTRFKPVTVG